MGESHKCRVCGATLSQYNNSGACWCHDYQDDERVTPESMAKCTGPEQVLLQEEYYVRLFRRNYQFEQTR